MRFEALSHQQCMDKLLGLMNYEGLRREQAELRKKGVSAASAFRPSSRSPTQPHVLRRGRREDRRAGRLHDQIGRERAIVAATGVTEQGQGTETIMAQIAATASASR